MAITETAAAGDLPVVNGLHTGFVVTNKGRTEARIPTGENTDASGAGTDWTLHAVPGAKGATGFKESNVYATGTALSAAMTTTVATIVAANADRRGLVLYNDGPALVYVKFGSGASTSSYTFQLATGAMYEMVLPIYTGLITGITAAGTATIKGTEGT